MSKNSECDTFSRLPKRPAFWRKYTIKERRTKCGSWIVSVLICTCPRKRVYLEIKEFL